MKIKDEMGKYRIVRGEARVIPEPLETVTHAAAFTQLSVDCGSFV